MEAIPPSVSTGRNRKSGNSFLRPVNGTFAGEIIESTATARPGCRWPEDAALSYTSTPKTTPNPLKTG